MAHLGYMGERGKPLTLRQDSVFCDTSDEACCNIPADQDQAHSDTGVETRYTSAQEAGSHSKGSKRGNSPYDWKAQTYSELSPFNEIERVGQCFDIPSIVTNADPELDRTSSIVSPLLAVGTGLAVVDGPDLTFPKATNGCDRSSCWAVGASVGRQKNRSGVGAQDAQSLQVHKSYPTINTSSMRSKPMRPLKAAVVSDTTYVRAKEHKEFDLEVQGQPWCDPPEPGLKGRAYCHSNEAGWAYCNSTEVGGAKVGREIADLQTQVSRLWWSVLVLALSLSVLAVVVVLGHWPVCLAHNQPEMAARLQGQAGPGCSVDTQSQSQRQWPYERSLPTQSAEPPPRKSKPHLDSADTSTHIVSAPPARQSNPFPYSLVRRIHFAAPPPRLFKLSLFSADTPTKDILIPPSRVASPSSSEQTTPEGFARGRSPDKPEKRSNDIKDGVIVQGLWQLLLGEVANHEKVQNKTNLSSAQTAISPQRRKSGGHLASRRRRETKCRGTPGNCENELEDCKRAKRSLYRERRKRRKGRRNVHRKKVDYYTGKFHEFFNISRDFPGNCITTKDWPEKPVVCRDQYLKINHRDTPLACFKQAQPKKKKHSGTKFDSPTGVFSVKKSGFYLVDAHLTMDEVDSEDAHWAAVYVDDFVQLACPSRGFAHSVNLHHDPTRRLCHMAGVLHLTPSNNVTLRTMARKMEIALTNDLKPTFTFIKL